MLLPFEAFGRHDRGRDGLQAACKACEVERIQVRKHGLTTLERLEIAQELGGCSICGRVAPGKKGWVIDHDHACCPGDTSCVSCRRGVLCQWCNAALGYAFDNPVTLRRAADYLELETRLA